MNLHPTNGHNLKADKKNVFEHMAPDTHPAIIVMGCDRIDGLFLHNCDMKSIITG